MQPWTVDQIPSQTGRVAIVTGTGGLGYEDALALARAGAEVILGGRNPQKCAEAVARIRAEVPAAAITFEILDLADLSSVKAFAERVARRHDKVHLLVNNAGVMVPPTRQLTRDGFELQFGTNYLGHFALTAHLLPLLQRGRARVVTLSSIAARQGKIDFGNLAAEAGYVPMAAYSQSKLACLIFGFELQRQSEAGNWGITSIAAHPGVARTDLLHNAPGRGSLMGNLRSLLWFLFQPAAQGALPTLYAATAPEARPGAYYGPHALGETRGYPRLAKSPPQALDRQVAARLWTRSEELTGVAFAAESPVLG